jgi:hypothetical protein
LKHLFLFIALAVTLNSFSQKKLTPTTEEKNRAASLKLDYPDDKIAITNSKVAINFTLNRSTNKVVVNQELNSSFISIDSRANIRTYCFYDGESTITRFEIRNKTNKKIYHRVYDESYTTDDLFHNDVRVKYSTLNFPLLGYKYKTSTVKRIKDIKYFTSIYFHNDYPTLKKNITIEVPSWLDIELKEINFEGYDIAKKVVTNAKTKIYQYTLTDIPAYYKEESAPGPTHIYPHILLLPKSYTYQNETHTIFKSTQDLYNWYYSLTNSLENDNAPLKDKVNALTKDAKNDDEKIKNIYYWVQDNIRYIAFEDGIAGFKPDEASNVFNKRYGDCKGMANLTKQMLIEAGFDARLAWIGTKRIAYDYSTPNLSVDNHMICAIVRDGETYFLDGTEKFNAYGEYADRIQGKQVLIENGKEYILKTIPEITSEFNKEHFMYNLTLNNDILEGKVSKEFYGESRAKLLYNFDTLKNDKKEEFLEYYLNNGDTNIKVSNIETSDLSNRESELKITHDITIRNSVSAFDNEIYIDIDFNKELQGYLLKERKTDLVFDRKRQLEATTTLSIPSGYTVSEIPDSFNTSSENFDLSVDFKVSGNTIHYRKIFKIKHGIVETSEFEKWNTFISQLKTAYKTQIVLTKN